jgi:hypothetical protein
MLALQTQSKAGISTAPPFASDKETSDDEIEFIAETDAERRQTLLSSEQDDDLNQNLGSGSSWKQFENDFDFSAKNTATGLKEVFNDVIDISSDDGDRGEACDLPVSSADPSPTTKLPYPCQTDKGKSKTTESSGRFRQKSIRQGPSLNHLGLGNIVQTEIDFRKKESLGMAPIRGGGRTLASKPTSKPVSREEQTSSILKPPLAKLPAENIWSCLVCTLENEADYFACSACTTARGEKVFQPT